MAGKYAILQTLTKKLLVRGQIDKLQKRSNNGTSNYSYTKLLLTNLVLGIQINLWEELTVTYRLDSCVIIRYRKLNNEK